MYVQANHIGRMLIRSSHIGAFALAGLIAVALPMRAAIAQDVAPQILPPPPPPPPPPKIEVPVVPQMDAAPVAPKAKRAPSVKKSFGQRIDDCLGEAAAAGLGPNERAAYSRACAQR